MAQTRTYDPFDIGMEYLLTASFDEDYDFNFDQFIDNLYREETDTSSSSYDSASTQATCSTDTLYQSAAATAPSIGNVPLQPQTQPLEPHTPQRRPQQQPTTYLELEHEHKGEKHKVGN